MGLNPFGQVFNGSSGANKLLKFECIIEWTHRLQLMHQVHQVMGL